MVVTVGVSSNSSCPWHAVATQRLKFLRRKTSARAIPTFRSVLRHSRTNQYTHFRAFTPAVLTFWRSALDVHDLKSHLSTFRSWTDIPLSHSNLIYRWCRLVKKWSCVAESCPWSRWSPWRSFWSRRRTTNTLVATEEAAANCWRRRTPTNLSALLVALPPDHLLLDRSPNVGPLISRWKIDKFKNFWNKSFRTFKILTLLYKQFSNLLISQGDMSGPRLGALSNNRWSGGNLRIQVTAKSVPSSSKQPLGESHWLSIISFKETLLKLLF